MAHIFGYAPGDPPGSFTGVVQIHEMVDGLSLGCQIPFMTPVMVELPLAPGRYSLYDYVVTADDGILYVSPSDESWHLRTADRASLSPKLLELCAGMGGMGIGCTFLGGVPTVAIDHSTLATEHLKANNHGTVLQLDLTAASTFWGYPGDCPPGVSVPTLQYSGLPKGS